jgi:FKBP-type peptidyl-prolyl cis-trans isomerase
MRRIAILLVPLLFAALGVAGCGSTSSAAASAVTVSGRFGKMPTVNIPAVQANGKLTVSTLISGKGPALGKTDSFVGNYAVYIWSGTKHKLAQSTFSSVPALFSGELLPGLQQALSGKRMGSRVLAVIPPRLGYGTHGGQNGVGPKDTLVFVVDLLKEFASNASAAGSAVSDGGHGLPTVSAAPGTEPVITIPRNKPPAALVAKTLIQGSGPVVAKGDYVVVQYVGVIWRTGKIFDASWSRGYPFGFVIDSSPAQVITGWDLGLTGKAVGSRVMLVIPPADGYGAQGSSGAGIKGTDTLVFVVDVLGAYGPNS